MSKRLPRPSFLLLVATVSVILLAGCGSFTDRDQLLIDPNAAVTLSPGQTLGQSFVAQHGGLNAIEFGVRNLGNGPAELQAHLRADARSTDDLAVAAVTVLPGPSEQAVRFALPVQPDSHNAYRYILLTSSAGEVQVEAGPANSYRNGSLYVNGQPAEAQARFRLSYDAGQMAVETGRAVLDVLRLVAAGGLIWALPGWALLRVCLRRRRWRSLGLVQKLALGAGAGVALYPVWMLWASAVHVTLGPAMLWGPVVLGAITLGVIAFVGRRGAPPAEPVVLEAARGYKWADVLLLVALLAIFVTRLLVIRTLDAPSWGDSVQHAAMAQLMVDQGGLFQNWLPYTPYATLSIQYGFASNAAVLQQLLGVDGAQATLLAGQLLSALAVFTLYPLALRIAGGNRWAGAAAVLVAGLLSPMPAFYVNWGRYAQLAGQVILPVAMWLLWEAGEHERFSAGTTIAASLALAGMMLSYYRLPYNYAAFGLVWLLFWAVPNWRRDGKRWARGLGRLAAIGIASLVLVLPWLSRVAQSSLADLVEGGLTGASRFAPVLLQLQQWQGVTDYAPLPLIIAGSVALVWALVKRKWSVVMMGPWVLVMAALVAARLVKLPGANLLQTFAVMILLYIPLSLLIGWLAGEVMLAVWMRSRAAGFGAAAVALAAIAIGALGQLGMIKPEFVLVTRPDTRAMTWIKANTPADSVFLVEGFRIYDGQSAVGSDGGWWIPLLAGRANTMPPQYALLNEKPIEPGYSKRIVNLVGTLETNKPGSAAAIGEMQNLGVTHVYIGQSQGETGIGARKLFTPEDLLKDPQFQLLYHEDRVYVFAIAPK